MTRCPTLFLGSYALPPGGPRALISGNVIVLTINQILKEYYMTCEHGNSLASPVLCL